MGHSAAEQRIAGGFALAHVRVVGIARQSRELLDVLDGDRAFGGIEGIAELQFTKRDAERVAARVILPRTARPALCDRGDRVGRALDGRALHVMHDTADAAHLLTASGPTRAPVHQVRQRRAMPGGFFGAMAIDHHNTAMEWGEAEHQLSWRPHRRPRRPRRRGYRRRAARAQWRPLCHRKAIPWRLARTPRLVHGPRIGRESHSSSSGGTNAPRSRSAPTTVKSSTFPADQLRFIAQLGHALQYFSLLFKVGERTHAHALGRRVTHHHFPISALAAPSPLRRPNRAVPEPCVSPVHFCPALAVISRVTSRMYRSNSGVSGRTSGASIDELRESVSATKRTAWRVIVGCDLSL